MTGKCEMGRRFKICFITSTRAEYGLLKWIMYEVRASKHLQLQLVVAGGHLLREQGHTLDQIIDDGFTPDAIVDVTLDTTSTESIATSMGRMAESFAPVFVNLDSDYVAVLGDRYELLPIVNTACVMCVPVIHFSGGDVTEGAIDDGIRNAVTMLSSYHFPGTEDSAKNIIRMRGTDERVWAVGEPGLDSFYRESLMSREELAKSLGLSETSKWVLFTYHPETRESLKHNLDIVGDCLEILLKCEGIQIVATYANADFGGSMINELLEEKGRLNPANLRVVPSLGNKIYLSFMREASFVMGNSSSGIVEAPTLGIPVVNIGDRQKGRHLCRNVIQTDPHRQAIEAAIDKALKTSGMTPDHYWGDGHTAERVVNILERELGQAYGKNL